MPGAGGGLVQLYSTFYSRCAQRTVLLFSNNFPCNFGRRREPIKVQARDLVSRQESVSRISGCRENSFGILPENTRSHFYICPISFQLTLPEMKFPLNRKFNFVLHKLVNSIRRRSALNQQIDSHIYFNKIRKRKRNKQTDRLS